jgi:hypothetical protein
VIYRGDAGRRAPEGSTDQSDGAIPGCTYTVTYVRRTQRDTGVLAAALADVKRQRTNRR